MLVSVLLGLLALGLVPASSALAEESTAFSGYEVFPGYHGYSCPTGSTCGTTFGGWTDNGPATNWVPAQFSNGGSWAASINYSGTPGPASSVSIGGGFFSWHQSNGLLRYGRILAGGKVTWPASLNTSICGEGVATFQASIITITGTPGQISGCLDDTHLTQVFPPHVWGTLVLQT